MPDAPKRTERVSRSHRFPSSKFCVPHVPSSLVHRPRLFDQLDRGGQRRLTLVVGSAGAGKTVLLGDWLAARPGRASVWLSCDVSYADPGRFFAAIIEALRRSSGQAHLGEDADQLLSLDSAVSADSVAALADDLERQAPPLVLVVDDVHSVGPSSIDALDLLIEYLPPTVQLVLATRRDPQLRLHRLRASHEMVEVRDSDLSFSVDETAELLSRFEVRLSRPDLDVVHQRSEGWAAGLQMAALSIRDSADPIDAARRVDLRGYTVAGYFLDEVLYRQPAEVVDFMLATSVLDELSAEACTALCGAKGGPLLERVHQANLFLVMVDEEARTYRYHHLVAEVLRSELHVRDPAREQRLHKLAAAYLADTERIGAAARHLLAAGEPTAAFRLLDDGVIRAFGTKRTSGTALDVDEVQPEDFAGAPEILVPLAAELLVQGAFERGSRALELARRVDHGLQGALALKMAFLDVFHYYLTGRLDEALARWDRAPKPELLDAAGDDWALGTYTVVLFCHTFKGDFAEARALADTIAAVDLSMPSSNEVLVPGVKSQVAFGEGALLEAAHLAGGALAAARRLGFDRHYWAFYSLRTTALLALERRDLAGAAQFTERSLGTLSAGRPIFDHLAQIDRARIWAAEGSFDQALASLPAARAALRSDHSVLITQADELESRLRLAVGDRKGAEALVERLPENRRAIASAVLALAEGSPDTAADALADVASPTTIRGDLELRLLKAAAAVEKASPRAELLVKDALTLGERQGFVHTVLDTAPQVVEHLLSHSDRYPRSDYVATLMSAVLDAHKRTGALKNSGRLPDALTQAELRVLEKLPLRLSYSELAADLHLSHNTVKTHLRNAYMKLGVSSRSAAVRRATALGLI